MSIPPVAEEQIAALAFRFYEDEGRPEGRADEHWQRAVEALQQAQDTPPENERPSEAAGEDFS
jgi:hypothetical protein